MLETGDHIILKLIDLLKQAFRLRETPDLICAQSRKSSEAILREIYKREFGSIPPKITFQGLLEGIRKKNVVPFQIILLFETVNRFGNMTLHPDDDLTSRSAQESQIVESNLAGICNWFFNSYLNLDLADDFFRTNESNTLGTALHNYEELLRSALSDLKLDIDEFENVIQARGDLGLSKEDVIQTEQRICLELLQQKVDGILDVLGGSDLESFKKLDKVRDNRPEWVNRCIENMSSSANHLMKNYIHYYFNEIQVESELDFDSMVSILGCWQGWYFQNATKTYFDLLFLAKKKNEFIGISIEPINPTWNAKGYEDPYLLAWIEGSLADDILFSYEKTMILEHTWSVDYEGVIIENGQLFEGEWRINSQNGSFNAMRSKSLLPIRIFDTSNQQPVVPSKYLNKSKDLTSSWLVQITGKTSITGVLHVIELRHQIFANLVLPFENRLSISYCEGEYDELAKVTLYEKNNMDGLFTNFSITFTVDWNNLILNGVIKDDITRMRVFKGFKI